MATVSLLALCSIMKVLLLAARAFTTGITQQWHRLQQLHFSSTFCCICYQYCTFSWFDGAIGCCSVSVICECKA
eukprot:5666-Heterococcus_DN1.PRE.2